jgi:hypothetical protein
MKKIMMLFLCGCLAVTALAEEESAKVKNLLKYDFSKLDSKGMPIGYKLYFSKESKGKATVSQEDGTNVIKLEIPEQGNGFLTSNFTMDIKKNKKYVITVQLKIENQKYSGKGMHFFYVCAYNTSNDKHIYNKLSGHGNTGGWVTVVLPVDTVKRPLLAKSKLLMRGYGVSGTYWLKNPMLVEIPNDVELKSHYILESNKTISGGFLRLGTIKR